MRRFCAARPAALTSSSAPRPARTSSGIGIELALVVPGPGCQRFEGSVDDVLDNITSFGIDGEKSDEIGARSRVDRNPHRFEDATSGTDVCVECLDT